MKSLQLFLYVLALGLLTACQSANTSSNDIDDSAALNAIMAEYKEAQLTFWPLAATSEGDHRFDDRISNNLTRAFESDMRASNTGLLKRLQELDRSNLAEDGQISYDVLKWDLEISNEGLDLDDELMPVNQMFARYLYIAQIASGNGIHPFNTAEDYDNWLSRMNDFTDWADTAMACMRKGIQSGHVLPRSLIEKMIPQMDDFTTLPAEEHLFYMPVQNFPEEMDQAERDRLSKAYAEMVEQQIVPTFEDFRELLVEEYLPAGRESSGLSDVPGGTDWYEYYIRYYTTTEMEAEEIYQLGLREVERIRSEMTMVMDEVGFEGSMREFFDFVRESPELRPYHDPQEVIDNFNDIHETMKPHLEMLFDMVPECPFEVRRTEAFREATATWEYNQGSPDGSRPGIFYVPVANVREYNVFQDEALFLHEAIPGHHYQISLQQENEDLPAFRQHMWYNAYGEGWALYTESLGEELGLYTDPYQYFGMLSMEMHRALRLVIDVGIHLKGWSREEAIEYSLDNEAEPEYSIISEIERYMAAPGQALSYKIGQLKIQELRSKAEETLGADFDIKEFHNQVLEPGCVPLAILEDKINNWIDSAKEGS